MPPAADAALPLTRLISQLLPDYAMPPRHG